MVSETEWLRGAVCEKGHAKTGYLKPDEIFGDKFCEDCGASMILECPSCSIPIRGKRAEGMDMTPYSPPAHCFSCGAALPWAA